MPFQQDIENARAETIGAHGVAKAALDDALARCEDALAWLRKQHAEDSLPLLRLPAKTDDLDADRKAAARLRAGASDVVVLGTGGSSLGGQTMAQLAGVGVRGLEPFREGPRVHFMDNLDPATFAVLLAKLPLATSRFIAISKSGGTGETLMQTAAALSAVKAAGLEAPHRRTVLRHQRSGEARQAERPARPARSNGARCWSTIRRSAGAIPVSPISGCCRRPSSVSISRRLRAGAAMTLAPVLAKKPAAEVPAAVGAALNIAAASSGKNIAVLMAYADRLERFSRWYVQLWAESLGKDGKGTTPLGALGPVDQHSQLQLFIAGPHDKLFTVITTGTAGQGPRIDPELAKRRRRTGTRRQDHRRSRRRAGPRDRRTRSRKTAIRCARSTSRRSTRRASANC